jgi:2-polyprenyl-6-methoxyphenol hydroxylase-like FAD-dependent oxidoreductase
MQNKFDADVLVIGAGPVGLSFAIDQVARGAKVTIVETRQFAEPPNVKCNHVSSRTMERFRRLGVAAKLRDAGLPADHANDVVFRTSVCGQELTRIPIPARKDRYTAKEGPDTHWKTPEPPHRINQIYLEPILLKHTAALPGISLMNRTQLVRFTQDSMGVEAVLLNLDTQQESTIRAKYLVGVHLFENSSAPSWRVLRSSNRCNPHIFGHLSCLA